MGNYTFHKPDNAALRQLLATEQNSAPGIIVTLAWQMGLLRGEIRSLRWSQVNVSAARVTLPDREIPIPPDTLAFLAQLKAKAAGGAEYVLQNAKGRPYAEQYISRLARQALDRAGQQGVRLIDLRHDFIVRQLQTHDWQHVAHISGVGQVSLRAHFMSHALQEKDDHRTTAAEATARPDPEQIDRLLESEGYSPAATLICLSYQAGLQVNEMQYLTWAQIDLSKGVVELADRTAPLSARVLAYLTGLKAKNGSRSDYVVISKRAGKPLEAAYISKTTRDALVSAGIADLTLSDLRGDYVRRTQVEQPIVQLVGTQGSVTRADVTGLLHLTKMQAYNRLSHMVASGKLVRVGNRYFLPEQTTPPDRHEALILDYLHAEGSAVRQDFARLLHILPRQVYPILQKLIASGAVAFENGRYYPAE